ncbi:MAG TPA: FtsX-like permease family protein [Acidimicrobiales bacterium]|nr:FtsX-like permease family protein [Acidimicrobiales bacterium]
MNREALRVAWYRFGATLHRRWGGYLTVVLLVGLVGGLAMGAVGAARRTQSAFPTALATTDASDLDVQIGNVGSYALNAVSPAQQRAHLRELGQLPDVQHVAAYLNVLVAPVHRDGTPDPPQAFQDNAVVPIASVNDMYFDQDRVTVSEGRMADPKNVDEFVATAEAAHLLGWHLGEVVRFGAFTFQQATSAGFAGYKPYFRVSAKLVGNVVFASQVVSDDVDRSPTYVLFTPALTARVPRSALYPYYGLVLDHGSADVAAVEQEIIHLLPSGDTYNFHVTSVVEGQVERATKPESIALAVFGAIAGVAALLIAGQAIGRRLGADGEDLDVLRALGASPAMTMADGLVGMLVAVVLGSVVALVVAVALSPLAPIGPARPLDPSPGIAFDGTVLGTGLLVLVMGLGALSVLLAYRSVPHRADRRRKLARSPVSSLAGAAAACGLPSPAVTGIRFALERGHGRTAVPVRSALLGSVLAVGVVVATLTFGSGLRTLVTHPALYGWNWSYAIEAIGGGSIPPKAEALLGHDPDVASWTGFDFANAQIDHQTVPILLGTAGAAVTPPILSGHRLEANNQIVLGAATLAELHKRVGETVTVTYGTPKDFPVYVPPTKLVVAGTATLPAVGSSGTLHTSMGTGALVPVDIEPPAFQKALTSPDPNENGPNMIAVRLRGGVARAAGLASVQGIANAATRIMAADPSQSGSTYQALAVQQPAEIVNYSSTGATPVILASGLAGGAGVALGLTLVASVRRRRRDLALLKTLGFTRRQLAATVAWQASVAAGVGVVVGVPVGIALGRWLWDLFARAIFAVPDPTVPVLQVVFVAVGAVLLANIVAAVPGRMAARTLTALLLRTE